jgi:hypothetical protein
LHWRTHGQHQKEGDPEIAAKRKTASRRELIDTGTNKLFVRRNARGTCFAKAVDAGRSITCDKRTKARRKVPSGQGDRGDRGNRNPMAVAPLFWRGFRCLPQRITPPARNPPQHPPRRVSFSAQHDHWHGGREYRSIPVLVEPSLSAETEDLRRRSPPRT